MAIFNPDHCVDQFVSDILESQPDRDECVRIVARIVTEFNKHLQSGPNKSSQTDENDLLTRVIHIFEKSIESTKNSELKALIINKLDMAEGQSMVRFVRLYTRIQQLELAISKRKKKK